MEEIRKEVASRINRLGQNEFRLAYSKSETKSANEIAELVEDFRKPYLAGRVTNMGSMVAASQENWARIAEEADTAAKRELLKNSAELPQLSELEKKAEEARKLAEVKSRELQANWEEFNSLPEKAEAISLKLAQINNSIRELDAEALKKQYRDAYRSILDGALTDRFGLVFAAEAITTCDLRKQVLNELAEELESELSDLRARSKVLGKRLGMKGNVL